MGNLSVFGLNNRSYPSLFVTSCLCLLSVHACTCSEFRNLQIFPDHIKCVNGLYSSHCLLSKAWRAYTKREPRHGAPRCLLYAGDNPESRVIVVTGMSMLECQREPNPYVLVGVRQLQSLHNQRDIALIQNQNVRVTRNPESLTPAEYSKMHQDQDDDRVCSEHDDNRCTSLLISLT